MFRQTFLALGILLCGALQSTQAFACGCCGCGCGGYGYGYGYSYYVPPTYSYYRPRIYGYSSYAPRHYGWRAPYRGWGYRGWRRW